jgi:lysozyme family protein
MDIALILQLVQLGAQLLQTTHAISPSPTTTSLSQIASAIVGAQDSNPIKWLQGALNATVGSNLAVDGQFGSRTEAAIEQLLERFLNPQESDTVLSAVKILLSKVR